MPRSAALCFLHCFICLAQAQVVINEVCPRNYTILEDVHGRHPDWIELHNTGNMPVDLAGHHLSDRVTNPAKWTLPPVVIPAGGHLLFYSGEADQGDHYFDFGISGSGETVILSSSEGYILDQLEVPTLHGDHSYGLTQMGPRIFDVPTPGSPNSSEGYSGYSAGPQFDPAPGIYSGEVQVTLASNGAAIHHTIDGREPGPGSPTFNMPLSITGPVIIRAISIAPGLLPSEPVAGSYLVNTGHDLPVISIAVDPDSMFHEEFGIHSLGSSADTVHPFLGANFWEPEYIPAHLEFIENGSRVISQKIDLRIQGGTSARTKPQKPLRLTARNRYGNEFFEYPFFPERPFTDRYRQLVLRNAGGDFCLANFRDGLFHQMSLHNELDIDVLAFKPAVVYINGEYWGVMNIRERVNVRNIALLHDLDPDEILLMDGENESVQGDTLPFFELKEYIRSNDMNSADHFAHVEQQLDIPSLIDYFALEMYAGNVDWPANNVRYWKPSITTGRWRYLMHDLDATMMAAGYIPMDVNMFDLVLDHWAGKIHSEVFRGLLANDEFRRGFINRLADLMNTAFLPGHFKHEVDLIANTIEGEMPDHYAKWQQWIQVWHDHARSLIPEFAQVRPGFMRDHIVQEFQLPGTVDLTFDVFPPDGGTLKLNTIEPAHPFRGVYFSGNDIDLELVVADGFTFDHWEFSAEPDQRPRSSHIRRDFSQPGRITAVLRQRGDDLKAWPMPAHDALTISVNASNGGEGRIMLHDASGRALFDQVRAFHDGTNRVHMDLGHVAAGVHILTVDLEGRRHTTKVVKVSEDR